MQRSSPGSAISDKSASAVQYSWKKGGIFALLYIIFGSISVFVSYMIATLRGNVRAFLPFISKSGGMPPQHIVFNLFAYIAAICALGMLTVRYIYVANQNKEKRSNVMSLNKFSYVCSLLSVVGLALLASYPVHLYHYQEVWRTSVLVPHMIGATMMFGFGGAYFSLQTILSLIFYRTHKTLFVVRAAISLMMGAPLGICAFKIWHYMGLSVPKYLTVNFDNSTLIEEYTEPFLICTVSEWVATILFLFYIATFVKECNSMSLHIIVRCCPQHVQSRLLTSVMSQNSHVSNSDTSNSEVEKDKAVSL